MQEQKLFKLLLAPSFFSGLLCAVAGASTVFSVAWSAVNHNQLFYNYLFGPFGFTTVLGQKRDEFSSWHELFFSNHIVYYVMLVGVAFMVGLTVYTILQALGVVVHSSTDFLHDAMGVRKHSNRTLFYRLLLRACGVAGWIFYAAIFFSFILPYGVLLANEGALSLSVALPEAIGRLAGSFVLLFFALHVHVMLLRTVLLKPRAFGGVDEVLAAETH